LLYMLLQRAGTGTVPPPGFTVPPWESLASAWDSAPEAAIPTVTLGPTTISLGHHDLEADDTEPQTMYDFQDHEFGWDNEHGIREVQVGKFRVETRPITNGEFYEFYTGAGKGKVDLPASWVEVDGETRVRTLYGPVPMKIAKRWPVMTSYNNLSTYASVKGGRIPTEPELRLFYDKFASGYEGGANIGFRNWHPVPATAGGERMEGKGHNGGVWEWTSTVFDKYDGFVPSKLYPGYSMDFFDNCHQVVLGGSYATIPRIAERRSIRNWYQSNYVYPWVGARIAYDL
jgi:formylglycine-generating enzyme required for sulfatase activity